MVSQHADYLKISIQAPITLLLVAGALAATFIPGSTALLALQPASPVNCLNPLWYLGLFGHVFVHAGIVHWANNMALILLLAPALEKQLGSLRFLITLTALTFFIGISEAGILMFTRHTVVGASGLVFALILGSTFSQSRQGEIPLASLLVAVLWGIKEIGGLFTADAIANSAHLIGALWGFIWGLWFLPKANPETETIMAPVPG